MEILEAQNVDLISPFPLSELKRNFGWIKAYKQLSETDYDPHTFEEFEYAMRQKLPLCKSWGVIDKNHQVNDRHPAPLIGIVIFERVSPTNGYLHTATTRRVWGTGLIDQAMQKVIEELFTTEPLLTRVSAWMLQKNSLAQGLIKRLGFEFEGCMRDMVLQYGRPKNIVHFGLTRENWKCLNSQCSDSVSAEAFSVESEKAETRLLTLPETPTQPETR